MSTGGWRLGDQQFDPHCGCPLPHDWAHGVWEAVAATLARPLWRAFTGHVDTCPVCWQSGIWHCPEGRALAELLPEGYLIAVGATP